MFITFEGGEGAGKSTAIKRIVEKLTSEGYEIVLTREPGGTPIAEEIRNVILDKKNTAMDPRTEALLYAASRRQHLVEKVLPALEEGITVISDRFIDSSLAYQGCGREIGIQEVYELNLFAGEGRMPDKTVFLDIDAETGLERIAKGRTYLDRLDQESIDFHERVFAGYQKVIEMYRDRMIVLDASRTVEEVMEAAYQAVRALLDE